MSYPTAESTPMLIYAVSTAGAAFGAYSTETVRGQFSYSLKGVAPGVYNVFVAVRPLVCKGQGTVFGAARMQVVVKANATTTGVELIDWNTPDQAVPAPPSWIVPPDPFFEAAGQIYASARQAATAIAAPHAFAHLVGSMKSCPVNRACISVGVQHDGTRSAYFVGQSGSNADLLSCVTYVVHDPAGWRGVRSQCPASFPAVGQGGLVWLGGVTAGCGANVRSAPGPKGKVVGCVQHHTTVRIDGGPAYAPMALTDGIWWHLKGRGWMADDFLIYPEICGCD